MIMSFLLQVTLPLGSEMVQARVTVSPSNARVLCGFSSISTVNMGHQNYFKKNCSMTMQSFPFHLFHSTGINNIKPTKQKHVYSCWHNRHLTILSNTSFLQVCIKANKETKLQNYIKTINQTVFQKHIKEFISFNNKTCDS